MIPFAQIQRADLDLGAAARGLEEELLDQRVTEEAGSAGDQEAMLPSRSDSSLPQGGADTFSCIWTNR